MTKHEKLAALRSAFKKKEGGGGGDYYPFWTMPEGSKAVIRFLPDLDEDNSRGFLVEKITHRLPNAEGKMVTLPCGTMYGEACPICAASSAYYKAGDKERGKKYWKGRSYVGLVLVIQDPIVDESGESGAWNGRIAKISIGPQIYALIEEALADEDAIENGPQEFEGGYDFTIKKTTNGNNAAYNVGTRFSSRARDLTADEVAIADANLVNLASLLPSNPGTAVLKQALSTAMGNGFDEGDDDLPPPPKPKPKPGPVDDDDDDDLPPPPKPKPKPGPVDDDDDDDEVAAMLAQIRQNRNKS